jgi:hypothetical protein
LMRRAKELAGQGKDEEAAKLRQQAEKLIQQVKGNKGNPEARNDVPQPEQIRRHLQELRERREALKAAGGKEEQLAEIEKVISKLEERLSDK